MANLIETKYNVDITLAHTDSTEPDVQDDYDEYAEWGFKSTETLDSVLQSLKYAKDCSNWHEIVKVICLQWILFQSQMMVAVKIESASARVDKQLIWSPDASLDDQ
jgi:hypothetical protein